MLIIGPRDEFNLRLSELTGFDLVELEERVFPDGEICPRVILNGRDLEGEEVLLSIRMSSGGSNPNSYLVEVLLTAINLKRELGVHRIVAFLPYFPYARQDEIFRKGEPFSSKYVAELLESSGVDEIISVTVHLHRLKSFQDLFAREVRAINISGFESLARYLLKKNLDSPFILAPDTEGIHWARELAKFMDVAEFESFEKERDLATGEIRTKVKKLNLNGRNVIVVDDMVSTGGTMANAVREAKRMGAKRIVSAFVHPVLVKGALDRILGAGADDIVATDTLRWVGSKVSVTDEVSRYLRGALY